MRAVLLSIAAYALPDSRLPGLDSPQVEAARERYGGQLSLQPATRTRWYLSDLEAAEHAADGGDLSFAGQLMRSSKRDGVIMGDMSTRCGGLVRLPKIWRGPDDIVEALKNEGLPARSVFDEMCPGAELEALDSDGVELGIGVAELVPVKGRDYPVLVRRLPEHLVFRWAENRWYFRSAVGLIPITPGDGRWVLHVPGGREAPWQRGIWRALGRAFITKDHARHHRDNWEAKLANPARVAYAPAGAPDEQRQGMLQRLIAWGVNTVFALTPGWKVDIVESNGRGADSFVSTIKESDEEIHHTIKGQTVTADGGVGFANADSFKSIASDLIQKDGDALSHTLNTQVIPAYVLNVWGEERLSDCPTMHWDTTPAIDQKAVAESLKSCADGIVALTNAAQQYGIPIDARSILQRFNVPLSKAPTLLDAAEAANNAPAASASNVVPIRAPAAPRAA